MTLPAAQKIRFERGHGLTEPYADLYRFDDAGPRAPLVLYVGGAIGKSDHVRRSRSSPDPIAAEFEKAYALVQPGPINLLICPCPIDIGGYDGFLDHYDRELAPAIGGVPSTLACVGYSNGAQFATFLAVAAGARALALFGAAGMQLVMPEVRPMIEAAHRNGTAHSLPTAILFRNAEDKLVNDPLAVRKWLTGLDVAAAGAKPGKHAFRYYAENGATVEVFRFALEGLSSAMEAPR